MESLLALLSVLAILSARCNAECTEGLPEFRDQGKMSPALSLNEIQAVIPAYRISCWGVIVQWGVSTEKRGEHLIELQVWRDTGANTYRKVGGNWFNQGPPKGQKLMYLTPDSSQLISVQPGDIIGLYVVNNPAANDNFKIQYETSSGVQMLYISGTSADHEIIDPALTLSQDVALLLHIEISPYQPTEGTVSSASATVNLTVSVSPTSSPLPTDTFDPKTHRDKQLMNTVIVASTCACLVLVIVVVVAVALLLCLRSRKRKASSKTSNNHSPPVPGISNPNYTGDLKLDPVCVTQNPAYGQHPQPLAHEYETPSVNVGLTSHLAKPHSQTPQPDTYYETMGVFEESSEYVVMESTQVSQCSVDGPVYEELTYM